MESILLFFYFIIFSYNSLSCSCRYRVGPLFIEYSDRNFRLTRCPRCHRIADKYIEYELLLVLIDIVLHEDAAYHHLLYNRYSNIITHRVKKWLPIAVVVISILVKIIVFRRSIYRTPSLMAALHVIAGSVADIATYVIVLSCCWNYFTFLSSAIFSNVPSPFTSSSSSYTSSSSSSSALSASTTHNVAQSSSSHRDSHIAVGSRRRTRRRLEEEREEDETGNRKQEDQYREDDDDDGSEEEEALNDSPSFTSDASSLSSSFLRFYFAILFPEIFKLAIILLYIFDSITTSHLLFLLNSIIVSLQWTAIKCVTRIEAPVMRWKASAAMMTMTQRSGRAGLATSVGSGVGGDVTGSGGGGGGGMGSDGVDDLFYRKLLSSFAIAIVCRILANCMFYSWSNILVLGGFS